MSKNEETKLYSRVYFNIDEGNKMDKMIFDNSNLSSNLLSANQEMIFSLLSMPEQKLIKVFTTKELVDIKTFMETHFNEEIKDYDSLNLVFKAHNGVIINKTSLQSYLDKAANSKDIVIELKQSDFVIIMRG